MKGLEYEINKINNLTKEQLKRLDLFLNEFKTRIYRPSELGISARNINHWNKSSLVSNSQNHGWHKYNLTECLWLKIIIHLRELSISLDSIKKIREELFQEISIEQLTQSLQFELKSFNAKIEMFELEYEELNYIEDQVDPDLILLDAIIIDLVVTKSNWRLLFNKKGEVMFHKDNYKSELEEMKPYKEFMKTTHVSISLNHMLFEVNNELIEDNGRLLFSLLSENESEILLAMRRTGVQKVEVAFDKKEPKMLKVTKRSILDSSKRVQELLRKGDYQDIKIISQDGTIVLFENTEKIKLK